MLMSKPELFYLAQQTWASPFSIKTVRYTATVKQSREMYSEKLLPVELSLLLCGHCFLCSGTNIESIININKCCIQVGKTVFDRHV